MHNTDCFGNSNHVRNLLRSIYCIRFYYLFGFTICLILSTKQVRGKSRECHNHKPQPFSDTKRKRKSTKPNKHNSNKRTKSTKISSLFPKRGNHNAKRTEKHKNKITQCKTILGLLADLDQPDLGAFETTPRLHSNFHPICRLWKRTFHYCHKLHTYVNINVLRTSTE